MMWGCFPQDFDWHGFISPKALPDLAPHRFGVGPAPGRCHGGRSDGELRLRRMHLRLSVSVRRASKRDLQGERLDRRASVSLLLLRQWTLLLLRWPLLRRVLLLPPQRGENQAFVGSEPDRFPRSAGLPSYVFNRRRRSR
jgi:hypothetical protein